MAAGSIVFVHGFTQRSGETWGDFGTYIDQDEVLREMYLVHFFEYPTGILNLFKKLPTIQVLARGLGTFIDTNVSADTPVVLVGHSLGGLVIRRYVWEQVLSALTDNTQVRVTKILLYATPHEGAALARVARYLSPRNSQLRQLGNNSDFLDALNNDWVRARVADRIEVCDVVAGQDRLVPDSGAMRLHGPSRMKTLVNRDHSSCVKPVSNTDPTYRILRDFVIPAQHGRRATGGRGHRIAKIIAFDFDATLLRGLTYSWTLVWDFLGYSGAERADGAERFLNKELTYGDWCRWAVEKFRSRGLRRQDIVGLTRGLSLTANLQEGLERLRDAGLVTAILSGGIDVFLYQMLPNAGDLFDHIYINRFEFDSDDVVASVCPTRYDFDTKVVGLNAIALIHGCTMEQTVFVGSSFHDAVVAGAAGLSIAYPPQASDRPGPSRVLIPGDDFMAVANEVLEHHRPGP